MLGNESKIACKIVTMAVIMLIVFGFINSRLMYKKMGLINYLM